MLQLTSFMLKRYLPLYFWKIVRRGRMYVLKKMAALAVTIFLHAHASYHKTTTRHEDVLKRVAMFDQLKCGFNGGLEVQISAG